jgi:ParB-like chromosome segregation protein Spo0J
MASKPLDGASRIDGYSALPERFTIITDKDHVLYDPRNEIPLTDPALAALTESIYVHGVCEQIQVCKDGDDTLLVKNGNQRVRCAIAANVRRRAEKLDLIQVPFKIVRMNEDEAQLEKAAVNVHVKSPPMMLARQAQKLEALGKSKEQIAIAIGWKSATMVSLHLALLDCDVKVQRAIESGDLKPSKARELVNMPREQQREALDAMFASGATKGEHATRVVKAVKAGKPIPEKGEGKRMKKRETVQGLLDNLDGRDGIKKVTSEVVIPFLRWLLGEKDAESNLSDDVLEVLTELDEEKQAKKDAAKEDARQLKLKNV